MDASKLLALKDGKAGRLRVSPFSAVRWKDGKLWVLSARSEAAISAARPEVLLVLHAFSNPKTPEDVYKELGHLGKGFLFSTIAVLWQHEIITTSEEDDSQEREQMGATVAETAVEADRMAQGYAQSIAILTHRLAEELRAFGPHAHEETAKGGRTNVLGRLAHVQSTLAGIISELEQQRTPYLEAQLSGLGLSRSVRGLRLHLGCGESHLEGWINIDLPPAELALNFKWGLPFDEGAADYVYISHVFEHFYYKDEALSLLREIRRALSVTGVVRLVVPDIEKCIRAYAEGDNSFFEKRKEHWPYASRYLTPLEHFLEYAGAGIRPGNFWGHKYGYDFETLEALMREAGFGKIVRSDYMESAHEALRVDAASRAAGFKYQDSHYSLFVEASN